MNILNGIVTAIYNEFGTDYKIYTSKIEQGLKEPCFFDQCINPTNELFLKNRRKLTNQFAIQYFPSTNDVYSECDTMFENLIRCIEYINVDDGSMIRGFGFNRSIVNDVMTITVNYDLFVYKNSGDETMENYNVSQKGE